MTRWHRPFQVLIFTLGASLLVPSRPLPARQTLSVQDVLSLPVTRGDYRIQYGDDPLQFGDLRLPPGDGPFPVIVFIHGGCWLSRYGLDYVSAASEALRRRGFATWSLEYRRIGDPGGGWPGTFLDVASGTDFLRELDKRHPLDLGRIIAVGHSAGGHLALWLAARSRLPPDSSLFSSAPLPLSAVVSLAGVTDLDLGFRSGTCGEAVAGLMGGAPSEVPERYAQASPLQLLPFGVRQRIVTGALDGIVPRVFAEQYSRAAERAGEDVKLSILPDAGHFELISPESRDWSAIEEILESLAEAE